MRTRAIAVGCILLVILAALLAACTSSGTGLDPVPSPAQDGTVPARDIAETATTPDHTGQLVPAFIRNQKNNAPPDGPVTITVNSAKKVLGVGTPGKIYIGADPGEVFLVLDITVNNNGLAEGYVFTNRSIGVRNVEKNFVTVTQLKSHTAFQQSQDHLLIPPITVNQGDSLSGQVIFAVNDSAEYRVNLLYGNKSLLSTRPADFRPQLTTEHPVSMTINNVSKVTNFTEAEPMPGHIFLVLNVTITNNDIQDGYPFSWESVNLYDLRSGDYAPISLNNGPNLMTNFVNPVAPDRQIGQNKSVSGQIIFGIADSPVYRLNLVGANKTIIASRMIQAG